MLQEVHDIFHVHIYKQPEIEQSYIITCMFVDNKQSHLFFWIFKVFFQLWVFVIKFHIWIDSERDTVTHNSLILTTCKLIRDEYIIKMSCISSYFNCHYMRKIKYLFWASISFHCICIWLNIEHSIVLLKYHIELMYSKWHPQFEISLISFHAILLTTSFC